MDESVPSRRSQNFGRPPLVSHTLCGPLAEIVGVLQLDVCVKCCEKFLRGLWLRVLRLRYGLLDADDLKALRALANRMTCAIHFFLGSKPRHVRQFWFFHIRSSQAANAAMGLCTEARLRCDTGKMESSLPRASRGSSSLFLIFGRDLERKSLAVPERRAAV